MGEKYIYPIMDEFVSYRIASYCWCHTYKMHLRSFNKFCKENYPTKTDVTQEAIDGWSKQRETENNNSRRSRLYVIINLVGYMNIKKNRHLNAPTPPKQVKYEKSPHMFTKEELMNLFYACDHIEVVRNRRSSIFRKLMMPILFRLMYSTGMRTLEIVHLKKEDVNLETGVISIKKSKGYNQHYIVLHDSMIELIDEYERKIEKLCPSRIYFFPTKDDDHYQRSWITLNFKKLWYKYNTTYARAYDLRHHYAITNINSWYNVGIDFNSKILSLSKSMGHSSIEATMYYYTLVPGLADKLEELTSQTFDELIPKVLYEE